MQAWLPQDIRKAVRWHAHLRTGRFLPFSLHKILGEHHLAHPSTKIETIGFHFSILPGCSCKIFHAKVRLHRDRWPRQQRRPFRNRAASAGPAAAGISHQRPALPTGRDPGGGEELRILRVGALEGWNTGRSSGGRLGDVGWSEVGSILLLKCRVSLVGSTCSIQVLVADYCKHCD